MARGEIHIEWSVDYADDPKMIAAGERAEVLYIRASCLAKRLMTDGFIADNQLPRFGLSSVRSRAEKLVEVGLFERVEGGYLITAFLKRNKCRADILADRARDAERKRSTPPNGFRADSGRISAGLQTPETETETETKSVRARERASQLPKDWEPTEATKDWVREEYPAYAKRGVLEGFKDHARATGRVLKDWDAGFKNWVRTEAKIHPAPESKGPARTFL